MSTNSEWVIGSQGPLTPTLYPLLSSNALRALETKAAITLPTHTLMQRAGLALAQLTLAYAPHARVVWIACGRGNNGGDGLEASIHLQHWGKTVWVSMPESASHLPPDAATSLERAQAAGVSIRTEPPADWDVCIDAVLGIGLTAAPRNDTLVTLQAMARHSGTIIAADIPSGLLADTGHTPGACTRARATLSFLALKPGLLTANGRDTCGDIWLNTLGVETSMPPDAWVTPPPKHQQRLHSSHKGSFGDVAVVGGASGMTGAALLAGTAALHGGAGRVYLAFLDEGDHSAVFATYPALMQRDVKQLALEQMTIVAGCGGGVSIKHQLPRLLSDARQLVLDADALNAIAKTTSLQVLLIARDPKTTVITPHPLEAARLLDCSTAAVQENRLASAQALATRFRCTVALKGSGTVIAAPDKVLHINPTGNARLATAGTGDVLAGLIGSRMAQGHKAFDAVCQACFLHGQVADQWPWDTHLSASDLASRL